MARLLERLSTIAAGRKRRTSPNLGPASATADDLPDIMKSRTLGGDSRHAYQKIAHALAVVTVIEAGVILLLGAGFILYALNKQTDVMMIQWATGTDRWVRVVPVNHSVAGMDTYLEKTAESYVVLRESIVPDPAEMARRWDEGGDVWLFSAREVWDAFLKADAYQQLRKNLVPQGGSRVIQDNRINMIRLGPGQFRAEYTTVTHQYVGDEPIEQRWVSIVQLGNFERQIRETQRLENPFGTTVLSYGRTQL
jgi:type IV secretory pathway component VirB8